MMGDSAVGDREALLQNEVPNELLVNSQSWEATTSTEVQPPSGVVADRYLAESVEEERIVLYKRRWYVLLVYALVCATQGGVWTSWGPIAASSWYAFGWTDHTIALLSNWGPIAYLVGAPFFAWLMKTRGLRVATIATAGLVAAGAGLRCISSHPPLVTWLVHVGQALNGLAGPIAFGAATQVSETWFPVEQRTTATAIGTIFNGFGCAAPFLIGPFMVSTPANKTNSTISPEEVTEIRKEIMYYMYMTFGWCALLFVAVLVYFPSKPPTPPSRTAFLERLGFRAGLKHLVKNKQLWILSFCYAMPTGFAAGMGSVLDSELSVVGVSQLSAGWMGFLSSLLANTCGLLLGIFSDIFKRRMKIFVISFYSLSVISLLVFMGLYVKLIPAISGLLWVSYIIYTIGVFAPTSIFFELAAEVNYPVAEGTSHQFITWLNNIPAGIFLSILMDPSVGTSWINWSLLGSLTVTIPIMVLFKESYSRLDIDTSHPGKRPQQARPYLHGPVTPHPLFD